MTQVEVSSPAVHNQDLQALIEEARRRQHRRRVWMGSILVLVLALILGLLFVDGGSGHGTGARSQGFPATPSGVVALVEHGLSESYVVTYAVTAPSTYPHGSPSTLVVAQLGSLRNRLDQERWLLPSPVEWSYALEWPDGARLVMIKRPEGVYQCARPSPAASWRCQGPDVGGGGNGFLSVVELYEPVTQFYGLSNAVKGGPHPRIESTASTIAHLPVRCVTVNRELTWCLTQDGLLASFSGSQQFEPLASGVSGTLVALSRVVASSQFALPTSSTPWQGPWDMCLGSCFVNDGIG